mgnify:CR=1 FL=1
MVVDEFTINNCVNRHTAHFVFDANYFEQLKIENQTLGEKIEERNEELLKLLGISHIVLFAPALDDEAIAERVAAKTHSRGPRC